MGLAEDLKALQELREKHELSEFEYAKARDALMKKHAAPSAESSTGYFIGKRLVPLVLLVVVVLVGWRVVSSLIKQTPETNRQSRPLYLPPQPQPHSVSLTNGALTVNANSFSWYTFTVPPNATTVAVNGHFTATGGSGNDIIAYIMDEDALANFKNGHEARVYYNSQKVTQATISAVLPNAPATYYLVFDNRFSLLTPKAVQVNATLTYMQ
jgi:hypothetical protein